ncbi:hypothetical protein Bbelb_165960 [Branchiostoma belcheri]|nr:hypothetical protein Bbelb_165960 [Branchiostoma belcheri]
MTIHSARHYETLEIAPGPYYSSPYDVPVSPPEPAQGESDKPVTQITDVVPSAIAIEDLSHHGEVGCVPAFFPKHKFPCGSAKSSPTVAERDLASTRLREVTGERVETGQAERNNMPGELVRRRFVLSPAASRSLVEARSDLTRVSGSPDKLNRPQLRRGYPQSRRVTGEGRPPSPLRANLAHRAEMP